MLAGRLTAGQLFMFLILTMTIAGSIGQFSGLWTGLQEALGATKRLLVHEASVDFGSAVEMIWKALRDNLIAREVQPKYVDIRYPLAPYYGE